MPLSSRATANRAERAAAAAQNKSDGDDGNAKVTPRRPSTAATRPAPSRPEGASDPPQTETREDTASAQESAQGGDAGTEAPPARTRKPRADRGVPRPVAKRGEGDPLPPAQLRAQMKELEKEAKTMRQKHATEDREMKARHSQEISGLQAKYRALSNQLASSVFK